MSETIDEWTSKVQKRVGLDVDRPELLDDVPEEQSRLGEVTE